MLPPVRPGRFSDQCRVLARQAGTTKASWAAEASTHNAFRFAAGSMSGDISARGAFTALGSLYYGELPMSTPLCTTGQIQCRKRLGGMLPYYHRAAAWADDRRDSGSSFEDGGCTSVPEDKPPLLLRSSLFSIDRETAR